MYQENRRNSVIFNTQWKILHKNNSTFIRYIPRSLAKGANTSSVSSAMADYSTENVKVDIRYT
jgi:hypothetical protein